MTDLRIFLEQALGCPVPVEQVAWLREHVDPEEALDRAHAVHLLWLSACAVLRTMAEMESVTRSRVEVRRAYERTQQDPDMPEAEGVLGGLAGRLRVELRATRWWISLVERWETRQSRGLGVVRYRARNGPSTTPVRGTAVGWFAVREMRWPGFLRGRCPPLRYRDKTPERWRKRQRPQHVYAVDLVDTGQSLGTFASAAVAFEVAYRFVRRQVRSGPVPTALQRLLDAYRGSPPPLHVRSWPAEPHWRFVTCRRRVWGGRGFVGRGGRVRQRWEVRHGR